MLFDEFFNEFFDDFNVFTVPIQQKEVVKCSVCKRTYQDFRQTGKFGCGECYKTFNQAADAVIKQIHSSNVHKGKIPSKSGDEIKQKRMLEDLKKQLQEAVKTEDYEKAAKLHKQIREIENGVM